jgi:hypothetical protein
MIPLRVTLWATLASLVALPAQAAPPETVYRDIWQTIRARKVLFEDEVLGPLNLGVKVRNRVAILWGPVPSAELAVRAEARLRGMIELIDVRNELLVIPDDPREATPTPFPGLRPERAPPSLPGPRPFLRVGPRRDWQAALSAPGR